MTRWTILLLTTIFLLLEQRGNGQTINGQDPDFYDLKNYFPKTEEIQKLKIKEIILQTSSRNMRDTIRYNIQSGLIESELYYHKENDGTWTISCKITNYYTNNILDSSINTKYYWKLSEKGYSLNESPIEITQYDSLKRLILFNHSIQYRYIDSGNVRYIVRQNLKWAKDDFSFCVPANRFEKSGIDTTKMIYDDRHRLIKSESSDNNYYKIYSYENDKIIINEYRRDYKEQDYEKLEYTMEYKNGRLIKDSCIGNTRDNRNGVNGNFKTETNYIYNNGLINKYIYSDNSLGGFKTETFVKINTQ